MKKRKIKLKKKIIIFVVIILFILIFILYKNNLSNKLIGTWTIDNNTTYEFKKNNTGKLIVSLSEYKFKYKIKNNKLYIDFENNKSNDSEYKYKFINNKLILSNENGIFTFTKK